MTARPDIRQTVPKPEPRAEQLPRNLRTVPVTRNGLPEQKGYRYRGPVPMARLLAGKGKVPRCPYPQCGVTLTIGQTIRFEHKPGCPRGARVRRPAGRAS